MQEEYSEVFIIFFSPLRTNVGIIFDFYKVVKPSKMCKKYILGYSGKVSDFSLSC